MRINVKVEGEVMDGNLALSEIGDNLDKVARQFGYDPDNESSVIHYMVQMLKRGDLLLARIACLNDSDKITNDDLRQWIIDNLYLQFGETDHPWRVLWMLRSASKSDPDF